MTHASETDSFSEAMEWVYKNTNFPTLDQFLKDPDKWRNNEEDIFISLSQMETFFKSRVKTVRYFWRGKYRCDTIEQLQHVTRNEGFKGSDLEYRPTVAPTYGTSNLHDSKVDVRVDVFSKIEFRLMGGVVAND